MSVKRILIFLLFVHVYVSINQIANADVFLTSEDLNSALKQIQRSQLQMQNNEDYESALYTLGKTADDLAKLLTDEVDAHGAENEKLIELALERTEQLQVNISWVGRTAKFFYDGQALNDYLDLYPDGHFRMDSLYRTITRDFFLVVPETEKELQNTIEKKKSFIDQYSDFARLSEIELYLAIDYRDLYRKYKDSQENDKANALVNITRQQLQRIVDEYSNKDEGEIARRLLERFILETSAETIP